MLSLAGNIDSSGETASCPTLVEWIGTFDPNQELSSTNVQPVGMPTQAFAGNSNQTTASYLRTEGTKQ
jgi:hypothetical protein